jgi:hypothetical protein
VELELWCAWVVARVDRIGGCLYNFIKGVDWLGQAHVVRLNHHPDMSTLEIEGIASSLQCENISEVSGCESVFKRDMMKLIKYVINYSFFFCNMSFMLGFEHYCSKKQSHGEAIFINHRR